jgi:hypothetical protein
VIVLKGKPDIPLRECPESFISKWSKSLISLFWMCYTVIPAQGGPVLIPAGPPPSPGGMLDQDNATMEGFQVIRQEILSQRREGAKNKDKN